MKNGSEEIEEFSENSQKIRRNLIISSAIALFYKLSGAKLGDSIDAGVVTFSGIDDVDVSIALFVVISYHVIHFALIAGEKWRYLQLLDRKFDDEHQSYAEESAMADRYQERLPEYAEKADFENENKANRRISSMKRHKWFEIVLPLFLGFTAVISICVIP